MQEAQSSRTSQLAAVGRARAEALERLQKVAAHTHEQVGTWQRTRAASTASYMAMARSNRNEVERTRERMRTARESSAEARRRDADDARTSRAGKLQAYRSALEAQRARIKACHDWIANAKLAGEAPMDEIHPAASPRHLRRASAPAICGTHSLARSLPEWTVSV